MKLRWPFRRSTPPAPPSGRPPLPENWRAGDIAECINDDWADRSVRGPRLGERAMVLGVMPGRIWPSREAGWGLRLLGFTGWWDARSFRKVRLVETGADRRVGRENPARLGERRRELVD